MSRNLCYIFFLWKIIYKAEKITTKLWQTINLHKNNKNIICNNSMKEINKTDIKYDCKKTGEGGKEGRGGS